MRPGRELNIQIANEVFGYKVWKHKGVWTENAITGDRPLRNYSNDIQWAFEVAEKMKVTLIPVVENSWFAFVPTPDHQGWESPQAVLKFLEAGSFPNSGAAVNENPALAICIAALNSIEKNKKHLAETVAEDTPEIRH